MKDRETFYLEQQRICLYYQQIVFKFVRDLQLFSVDKANQKKFNIINESNTDLQYQAQVLTILNNIDLKKYLNIFANQFNE